MASKKFPHYWICSKCAEERGGKWPKDHVATLADMPCKYCDDKNRKPGEPTAPYVDYNWPGMDLVAMRD